MTETARAVWKRPETNRIENSTVERGLTRAQRDKQRRREHRFNRYESVMSLVLAGKPQAEISRTLGIDRRTIRRWTRTGDFPERKAAFRGSSVEEYRRYLDRRWQEGCHNASQLWREMHELGFTGRHSIVRNWVRKHHGPKTVRLPGKSIAPPTAARISAANSVAGSEAVRIKQAVS